MSERLVNVDRDTPMLLPVDMNHWVGGDDLVHLVISAVETMKLPALTVNRRQRESAVSAAAEGDAADQFHGSRQRVDAQESP